MFLVAICLVCKTFGGGYNIRHGTYAYSSGIQKNIITIWGNTTPQLGMYPYMPNGKGKYINIEADDIKCRPCSKIGYKECPKKHFSCMNNIIWNDVVQTAQNLIEK